MALFLPILLLFFPSQPLFSQESNVLPAGFVYLDEVIPGLRQEMNYFSHDNFVGEPIDGYLKPHAILSLPAATALAAVQQDLSEYGLGLKIFDAYRPQRAVNHFIRWAHDLEDNRMKEKHYPFIDKSRLFEAGYISSHSGHSRGSTVDLTLIELHTGENLDMGGIFDFFGPESWSAAPTPKPSQRANRLLLRSLMEKHGFRHYDKEWWHFTLNNEPYPQTYFDFVVQ